MIQVSVIIPHFNTPDLLKNLLDSIYFSEEVQVIVVDDKSDKFLSEYAQIKAHYSERVTFLDNTTNKKGAGVCRNIGLKEAKGRWLLFADADDYFTESYYEKIEKYFDKNYDLVYFTPDSVCLETHKKAHRHEAYKNLIDTYLDNKNEKSLYELIYTFVTPWGKLISKDVVDKNALQFDETTVANDVMFMTKCAFYAENIDVNSSVIYIVTRMAKTLTTKKDESKFDERSEVFIRRFTFLKERLNKTQLKYIHLDRIAISHVVNAIMWNKKSF